MISQDHATKGSCASIARSPSRKVIILPSLVASGNKVMMVFVCHVTLQEYVSKALMTLCVGALQDASPSLQVWWL